MSLRYVPIHKSLHRPQGIAGCDRTLFLITVTLSFVTFMTQFTVISLVWGIVTWPILLAIARKLFKQDPLSFPVYMNSTRYRKYYPPQATIWRKK